jgi:penicillin amidase
MFNKLSRTIKHFPLTSRFIVLFVAPLAAASWFAYSTLKGGLPAEHVVLTNSSFAAPISIVRDEHGVPHIDARTDVDAFYAIGYAHAQDRLWQLELQRRLVQGRLSEVFGKESVPQDTWFRTLGLYAAAKSAWPALSKEAQASLTAYAAGVNAGIAAQSSLPLEFKILNITPQPWTEIDSLAWVKMFAFNLGGNFRLEIARFIANQSLSSEQVKPFFPEYPSDSLTTIAQTNSNDQHATGLVSLLAFQQDLEHRFGLGGRAAGSNAWVVSGRLTATGEAFLANDPHLGLQIPSLWYAISAKGKKLNVAGMSLVGLPLVIFGHNANIAWGGTSMKADVEDLYLEHLDGSDPNSYDVNGVKEAFTTRTEEIGIRADFPEELHKKYQPIKIHVRTTRHGPIISDQFHVFDYPVSLRWTALDAGDTSYEAFYRLNFSQDWASFNNALHLLVGPALNMMYADRDGNIGYLGAGRIPIRKSGDGSIPSPGWNDEHEWVGFTPEDRWPQAFNPKSGFILNANNKIVGTDYPYFISRDWVSPARAQRIQQMLIEKINSKKLLTLSDMQHMQSDTLDIDAQAVMAELYGFVPQSDEQAKAWSYLKNWNGDMAADSQAAAIFHVWMRHFRKLLFTDPLKSAWKNTEQANYVESIGDNVELADLAKILKQHNSPWCAVQDTAAQKSCQTLLASSLQLAVDEIYKLKGDHSMASWKWGALQQTVYIHTPFSKIKPFDRIFEERIANGGSENSINVASSQFNEKEGYQQSFGSSFRQIIGLDQHHIVDRYMNSTGQSGNLVSQHYADMVEPFRDVHYYLLEAAPQQLDASLGSTHDADVKTASKAGSKELK